MAVAPHQHPNINEVEPLSESDLACLRELRSVLQRHDMVERFGVHLLHSHFELSDDEIFVEEISPRDRTLTQRATKIDQVQLAPNEGLMTTAFDLIDEPSLDEFPQPRSANCRYVRAPGPDTPHEHVEIAY